LFANLSFSSTKSSPAFEKVISPCGELVYFFGYEPLRMSEGKGVLVSYWGFDPRVKSLQVNYHFARTCLETFGIGFGGRASVPSKGLNLYLKVSTWGIISFPFLGTPSQECFIGQIPGRGTKRPLASSLQDVEEVDLYQYRNGNYRDPLAEGNLRKVITELTSGIGHLAVCSNRPLRKAQKICTRQILTTGMLPLESERSTQSEFIPGGCVICMYVNGDLFHFAKLTLLFLNLL